MTVPSPDQSPANREKAPPSCCCADAQIGKRNRPIASTVRCALHCENIRDTACSPISLFKGSQSLVHARALFAGIVFVALPEKTFAPSFFNGSQLRHCSARRANQARPCLPRRV